jgi:hypothetical protein
MRVKSVLRSEAKVAAPADGLCCAIHLSNHRSRDRRSPWRRVKMRSNREKKKPKQDKNKGKGTEAHSPFAGIHSEVKPGTSYKSQYGKKH